MMAWWCQFVTIGAAKKLNKRKNYGTNLIKNEKGARESRN
jgi:hypothetical protein